MTPDSLNKVYDVLVNVCGASEHERAQFVQLHSEPNYPREWRFQGYLGYGGKFWRSEWNAPYVNCYPEDRTPERDQIILEATKQLKELSLP
jgi:hypothetical protein